jgi:hypothetical protein
MKLDHQHRPFWGFVERHLKAIILLELALFSALIWGYTHIDTMASYLHHHL